MVGYGASLNDLPTPLLILDLQKAERNIARMRERADRFGVALRPHMKTAKCAELARLAAGTQGKITVSTVAEVEFFARDGFRDVTYAVGIAVSKLPSLAAVQATYDAQINLLVDDLRVAYDVAAIAEDLGAQFGMFIEIDCGGRRGGVRPDTDAIIDIAAAIAASPALNLVGVLTHAGQSYNASSTQEIISIADVERLAVVEAAERLRRAGFDILEVSVGSTPTATFARSLFGVTEMRPGVYMFGDLDQVALGTCVFEDIAISVAATVIGHNAVANRVLIDAGGLALSKDLSAGKRDDGIGYGLVAKLGSDDVIHGVHVAAVHQEHGFLASNEPFERFSAQFPIGDRIRILPNHACMTAAPYDRYYCTRGTNTRVIDIWTKIHGWTVETRRDCTDT